MCSSSVDVQTACVVATAGVVVEVLSHRKPPVTTCVYAALWCLITAARTLWLNLCEAPSSFAYSELPIAWRRLVAQEQWQRIVVAAEEAQALGAPTLAFLSHALSCVPVLVLGLMFLEGAAFVAAMATLQLSVAAYYDTRLPQVGCSWCLSTLNCRRRVADGARSTLNCRRSSATSSRELAPQCHLAL